MYTVKVLHTGVDGEIETIEVKTGNAYRALRALKLNARISDYELNLKGADLIDLSDKPEGEINGALTGADINVVWSIEWEE